LRRLFALQLKEPLTSREMNLPEVQKMAVAYKTLGSVEELRTQIVELALERAFMAEPLPQNNEQFQRRLDVGRARMNLIAQDIARWAAALLV
jgi:ATP-dependent helicase HrpA